MNDEQIKAFGEVVKPLMKWLSDNQLNSNVKVIVTSDGVEIIRSSLLYKRFMSKK
jgi:stringent starvation protein B